MSEKKLIYLDNAATTWPKPPCVTEAITDAIRHCGGNPGRGGHRLALAAGEILYNTRDLTASYFGCDDPFRVTFTMNITMAVNLVLRGTLQKGDHVLISPMEHNAVMRPLTALGIRYDILRSAPDGTVDLNAAEEMVQPDTKMIIICHESNVNGTIQPIREIGEIAHRKGLMMLADCAQSAGNIPIDIDQNHIDFLCFTGHKGLYGPTGTGGIVFGAQVNFKRIQPIIYGGTGSLSESYNQPEFMPDHFESGTQNVCGLAGLGAGIKWLNEQGSNEPPSRSQKLTDKLKEGLQSVPGIHIFSNSGHVLSITIDGVDNGEAAIKLEEKWGIMTRIGLHCAPLAHQTLKTFPQGTIRFAVSAFNTEEDIDTCIQACQSLAEDACHRK